MSSVSINREKIIEFTRALWAEQGTLDLDQVDGTFYIHVCMAEWIAELEREAQVRGDYRYVDAHVRAFLPNAPQSTTRFYVLPDRPRLRDAVEMSSIQYGGRLTALGEPIHQGMDPGIEGIVGLAWVRLGIRNREWTGRDVARVMLGHDLVGAPGMGVLDTPRPPYLENESMVIIGATLYRDGEYGRQIFWDPTQDDPESPPEFWDERGRGRVLIDRSDPRWEVVTWPPMVVIAVAEPLPPASVIAEYYDRVVIEQRGWNEHLMGANNGQTVATAIRTWAAALLIADGVKPYIAYGDVAHAIGGDFPVERVYFDNRKLLLRRVPEAAPFFSK